MSVVAMACIFGYVTIILVTQIPRTFYIETTLVAEIHHEKTNYKELKTQQTRTSLHIVP